MNKTYYFTSPEGEDFFVEAENNRAARECARDMFGEGCKYHGVVSEEWAEMQGFDTYSADTYC